MSSTVPAPKTAWRTRVPGAKPCAAAAASRNRLEKLMYCEVVGRTLLLHLDNGQVLESTGGLDKLAAELTAYENFVRPHRSYLVNMDHIQSISYRGLQLTDQTEIPIPHGRFSELKERYLEYAFSRKQVLL